MIENMPSTSNNNYLRCWLLLLIFSTTTILTACTSQPQTQYPPHVTGNSHLYYVSKNGKNGDGLSWSTAWNELDKINWPVIQPGDTILIDGGPQQMIYTTTLTIKKSGIQTGPITIKKATDAGRNGHVIIFGGRRTPLPYCNQPGYTVQTIGINATAISIGSASWIVIDGGNWDGISIHGTGEEAVYFDNGSSNDTIRNLETFDNGAIDGSSPAAWGGGILIYGSNHIFERVNIHDDAGDAFQPSGMNITITKSWLHQSREDPTQPGTPFNQCEHQDGYQIWDGGTHNDITVENSILGPGEKEGTILGQTPQGSSHAAIVNNVTLKNDLFINKVINIMGYPGLKETGWNIDHVTVVGLKLSVALWVEGDHHSITNSIFYNGHIILPDGLANASGNCQWNTDGNTSAIEGQTVDPQFMTDASSFNDSTPLVQMADANFAVQPNSPCAGLGSSITSVTQLIAWSP
jgi:hypothetical protein